MKLFHLIVPLLVVFTLFLPIGVSYTDSEISDDLFTYAHNYYKLEETGFNYDSEVYGSLSFTTGTTPLRISGIINNGQSFNGIDDIIRTINSSSLQMQEVFICVWVYLNDSATSRYVFNIGEYIATGDRNGIYLQTTTGDKFRATSYHGSSLQNRWESAVVYANKWYHVCVSYGVMAGETESKPKIFLNGTVSGSLLSDTGTPNTISYLDGTSIVKTYFGGVRSAGVEYFGKITTDELYIGSGFGKWNESHAKYLFDSGTPGVDQQYPFLYEYSPPVISLNYPLNNSHIFWNGSLSVNLTDADIGQDHDCIFNISGSSYLVDDTNWPTFTKSGLSVSDGVYNWNVTCLDWKNTTHLYGNFIHDSINPALIVFKPTNKSIINKVNISSVNFTINVRDLYLWKVNTTITGPGGMFFNNYSGELNAEWFNLTEIFDTSNMTVGNYSVRIEAADTHTAREFKEKIDISGNIYHMEKGDIEFKLPGGVSLESKQEKDRYTQKFDFGSGKTQKPRSYSIRANEIHYLADSSYPCHFIINDRYWYDCVGLDTPKVSKKSSNEYEISFIDTDGIVETHSLGGLNMVNFTGWFYITTTFFPPVHTDTTIGYVYNMFNNTALPGAVISVYVYNSLWLFDTNYTTDTLGRSLIGFAPGYNYTFIVSNPGFQSKNISIGEIIYPEYAIGLTESGVKMEPILLFLFGGIALSLFIFSLGIRKISVSVISGVLCLVFAAMIWTLSLGFGIGFILIGIYSFIQIML